MLDQEETRPLQFIDDVTIGSTWRHRKGPLYIVKGLTNEPEPEKAEKFPRTVFYHDLEGRYWTRTLESWLQSFTFVSRAVSVEADLTEALKNHTPHWKPYDASSDVTFTELAENFLATRDPSRVMSTPAAEWRELGEADPHGSHYDCERAQLTLGNLTDDSLANGIFMNYNVDNLMDVIARKPGVYSPIVWMTAGKERIRWLSRTVVKLQDALKKAAGNAIAAPVGFKLMPVLHDGKVGLTDAMMRAFYTAFNNNDHRGGFEKLNAGYNAMVQAFDEHTVEESVCEMLKKGTAIVEKPNQEQG